MIVEMDLYYEIRTRYNAGQSIRSIAKGPGIARQTVKKYCEGNTHPDVRKDYHRESEVLTQSVLDFIKACLAEDQNENLSKQWHTPGVFMKGWSSKKDSEEPNQLCAML